MDFGKLTVLIIIQKVSFILCAHKTGNYRFHLPAKRPLEGFNVSKIIIQYLIKVHQF